MIPSRLQSLMSNTGNGHLVYVRRKSETELGKGDAHDNQSNGINHFQLRETNNQDDAAQNKSPVNESKIFIPEISPNHKLSSVAYSSARSSISAAPEKSHISLSPVNLNHLCFDHMPAYPVQEHAKHWEERYWQLQDLLRNLDESDNSNYIQMLLSLSTVELSKHAVELEKRSIWLSLEEGKELQRVLVLEKCSNYCKGSLNRQDLLQR